MLACFATLALIAAPMTEIAPLAAAVEADARALRADVAHADQPAYQAELRAFSQDAMALSQALRTAGLTDDLPCIFKGISEDTLVKADAVRTSAPGLRPMAQSALAALLDDAILLAPMAASAAQREPD
jgi:hypothetical protein